MIKIINKNELNDIYEKIRINDIDRINIHCDCNNIFCDQCIENTLIQKYMNVKFTSVTFDFCKNCKTLVLIGETLNGMCLDCVREEHHKIYNNVLQTLVFLKKEKIKVPKPILLHIISLFR